MIHEDIMSGACALAALIHDNHDELLTLWRKRVRQLPPARTLDRPTVQDHIPVFLREVVAALAVGTRQSITENIAMGSAPAHGMQRLQNGFDLEEVVSEYNILRDCIQELADKKRVPLQGDALRILNFVMDRSIGAAVKAYAVQQALDIQRRREEHLAFVAHDLRTPLSAIAVASQAIDQFFAGRLDAGQARKMLGILQRNAGYLTVLVNRILDENASMETESGVRVERRSFDLWPLVESLIHDLRPIAGTGSTALINQVPDDLTMFADASLIKRVFQNLVANAINHTPSGEVVISARREGDVIECEVRDNGTGISDERLSHIFEKYETDHKTPVGMGLGLSICKAFVEAHGGHITVESCLGNGSSFRFTLHDQLTPSENRR